MNIKAATERHPGSCPLRKSHMVERNLCHATSEQDKEDLLQALDACRKALQTADTRLKPFGEEYTACLKALEAIDGLAGALTGDRAYFQEKLPPSSPPRAERLKVYRISSATWRIVEGGSSMRKKSMPQKLYMVVEHYKDAEAVYRRLWERGRIAPEGLEFVAAWFEENVERCYRLMQTHDCRLLDEWMANWHDLIDFEMSAVTTP